MIRVFFSSNGAGYFQKAYVSAGLTATSWNKNYEAR